MEQALKKAIDTYGQECKKGETYEAAVAHVKELEQELKEQEEIDNAIEKACHKKAGMLIGLGFMGCFGQLTGMGISIYSIWDWNTVEPMTWMF